MRFLLLTVFTCIFALNLTAQDLPVIGSIGDLQNKTKIYITADAVHSKAINKELKKQKTLVTVADPETAEFFVEYKTLNTKDGVTSMNLTTETGQMDVYHIRDGRKVIAWQDSSSNTMRYPSSILIKKFLKVLKQENERR